jgi:tetratricopeptide (TPR) repeat protein
VINFEKLLNYVKEGRSLKEQGKKKEAILVYKKALKIKNDDYEIYNNIGVLYSELDNFEKAILNYRQAVKLNPKYSIAYNNLGNALQFYGDIDQAIIAYETSLKIQPDFSLVYRNLSTVKKFKISDPILLNMLDLIKNKNLPRDNRINLNYALGKAHNDIKDYKKAYFYFNEANDLNSKKINYNIQNDENFFKVIKNLFSNNILSLSSQDHVRNNSNKKPIFILGMPRSGSTLVEQIISCHSEVYGAGELDILDRAIREINWKNTIDFKVILQSINSKYLSGIDNYSIKENFVTDKMPLNFRWIGFILLSIPEAKIIHTKRNAIATCWSIYKNFFKGEEHGFSYDQGDIVRYYKIYLDLMSFWKNKFPGRIYDFAYEKVTENIELESKKVLEFIGLEWQNQCIDFHETKRVVKTNSAYQVRQGLYKDSVAEWENYREFLNIFLKKLA